MYVFYFNKYRKYDLNILKKQRNILKNYSNSRSEENREERVHKNLDNDKTKSWCNPI